MDLLTAIRAWFRLDAVRNGAGFPLYAAYRAAAAVTRTATLKRRMAQDGRSS